MLSLKLYRKTEKIGMKVKSRYNEQMYGCRGVERGEMDFETGIDMCALLI